MTCRFKPLNRDQQFLLPPSMRDWLPEGDLAYFIIDVAASLDLREIYQYYEFSRDRKRRKAASGQPPYNPEMMVSLLLYGYCNGTPSSRRIARLCERDAGYRVVSGDQAVEAQAATEKQCRKRPPFELGEEVKGGIACDEQAHQQSLVWAEEPPGPQHAEQQRHESRDQRRDSQCSRARAE